MTELTKWEADDIVQGLRFRFAQSGKVAMVSTTSGFLRDGDHDVIFDDGATGYSFGKDQTAAFLNDGTYQVMDNDPYD